MSLIKIVFESIGWKSARGLDRSPPPPEKPRRTRVSAIFVYFANPVDIPASRRETRFSGASERCTLLIILYFLGNLFFIFLLYTIVPKISSRYYSFFILQTLCQVSFCKNLYSYSIYRRYPAAL